MRKLSFTINKIKSSNKSYNQVFVNKITKAEKEIKEGKGVKITSDDFDNLFNT